MLVFTQALAGIGPHANAPRPNTASPSLPSPSLQPLKVQSLRQTRRGSLLNPGTAPVPDEPSALCAVATGLARRATDQNFSAITDYAARLAREYGTLLVKPATRLSGLAHHPAFTRWAVANGAALA